jgi:uncharacterized surface protein with fasciclin (FAS1) repeats
MQREKERVSKFKAVTMMAVVVVLGLGMFGLQTSRAQYQAKDIVDTAVAAGQFKTLAAALTAAGLVDTLKGAGPFTVFAPTDEAFAKLPAGTVDALLKDIPKLKSILTYHVVAGKVMAADVVKLNSAKTLNGQSVKITVKGGKVMVDNANVVKTDIECSNGVIHDIRGVTFPQMSCSLSFGPLVTKPRSAGTENSLEDDNSERERLFRASLKTLQDLWHSNHAT